MYKSFRAWRKMDVYKEKDELLGQYKETGGQKFTDKDVDVIKVKHTN